MALPQGNMRSGKQLIGLIKGPNIFYAGTKKCNGGQTFHDFQ